MVIFTARMAKSTKKMAEATYSTVSAEQSSIEQAKDALMPIVDIEWFIQYPKESGPSNQNFRLMLRNYGSGPAFIREVTPRNEVALSSLYHSQIRQTILQPKGKCVVELQGEPTIRVGYTEEISSLSIWYTDVYGRWFRARLVVKYPRREHTQADMWIATTVMFREFLKDIPQPTFSYGDSDNRYPANFIGSFELGRVVPASILTAEWYTLQTYQKIQGLRIEGTEVTHNQPLLIRDISYWLMTPYPAFTLQIGQYPPFVLGVEQWNDDPFKPFILSPDKYANIRFGPSPSVANVDKVPLEKWGLQNSNRATEEVIGMYRYVRVQIKAIIMPLENDTSELTEFK